MLSAMRAAVLAALMLAVATPALARKQPAPAALTQQGETLKADYTKQMESVQGQLVDALPKVSDQAKAEYKASLEAEAKAKADLNAAKAQLGKIGSAKGLIGHATGHWIPKADRGIKAGKDMLAKAKTQAEKDAANAEIKKWQDNRKAGEDALAERKANYEKLKADEPKFKKQVEQSQAALTKAQARVAKSLDALRLDRALKTDKLDGKLAKFVVLKEATPHKLAAFAQESASKKKLVDQLLADEKLMLQMVYAGGAKDGNYGRAMQIYTEILKASPKAKQQGIYQELALGIALEHAKPIEQRNAEADTDAPKVVDPVGRYKHYEKAYLAKELDPYFDRHEAWELRYVVNGNEPDEILTWGREMLRNYRPDIITTKDDRWRYVSLVRTCVRYGSQENKNDKPELQFFQNILMNGGICGRRAFFGRFILRSFGVPTVAKPQKGHAALGRWTPDGWVACLGAGWGTGWAPGREMAAPDFLAMTQARELDGYMQVQRAFWIGDLNGEPRKPGFESGRNQTLFWNSVALNTQKQLIETAGTKTLAAVGEELGEANESKVKYPFVSGEVTAKDREISVSRTGVITIPAVAATSHKKSTGKVLFVNSSLGGMQMHYSRNGGDQDVKYEFDAPAAGTYALTMRVAVPAWKQNVSLIVNGKVTTIELPHTVGMWETTKPIKLQLKKGKNTLTLSRKGVVQEVATKGFTIRDYTLSPVGGQQ